MSKTHVAVAILLTGIVLGLAPAAFARAGEAVPASASGIAAPDYGSGFAAGSFSDQNFNTPESDGRPGVKFFAYAVQAYRNADYIHAVDMYKLAAYWAYAPAAYNLGVMYYRGQGVPVDRPLGAAWMVIAAEQGNPRYAVARDQMVTLLTHAEFAETDRLFGQLQPKYGEQVTMRRAKARWAYVRSQKTGSRVGGDAGELNVGVLDTGAHDGRPAKDGHEGFMEAGFGFMTKGSLPGAVAYRQFQQSDNPYSPIFEQRRKGSATVGALEEIKQPTAKPKAKGQPSAPTQPAG